tara:strand:- start:480 stop:824 length:345 start_codon:yes stop_codon:yes gene_type:complete
MRITKDNINEFINKTRMYCNKMDITYIEYIPESITHLYCYNNKLTELPKLPDGLKSLNCSNNQLTSLPKLPDILKYLKCSNNNLPYPIQTKEEMKKHNKLIKRKEILEKIRFIH